MYFTNFPQTTYNGTQCIDLSRRTKIVDTLQRQPIVFYPYQLGPGQRPDTLAYDYYNDSSAEWAVLLGNQIMDPYYGWYLAQDDFQDYLTQKYGSLEEATSRIHHWETNWADVTYSITVDYFNGLPDAMKKYWIPNFGIGANILNYTRRQDNWTMATNKIVQLSLDRNLGFQTERVAFFSPNSLQVNGLAEIITIEGDVGTQAPTITVNTSGSTYVQGFTRVGGSQTLNSPVSTSGDTLLMAVTINGFTGNVDGVPISPSQVSVNGWALVASTQSGGTPTNTAWTGIFTKITSQSEPPSYAVTLNSLGTSQASDSAALLSATAVSITGTGGTISLIIKGAVGDPTNGSSVTVPAISGIPMGKKAFLATFSMWGGSPTAFASDTGLTFFNNATNDAGLFLGGIADDATSTPSYVSATNTNVGWNAFAIVALLNQNTAGTLVNIQHVQGDVQPGMTVVGQTSGQTSQVVAVDVLQTLIDTTEATFWQPVTMMQNETNTNEQNKFVMLIDSNFYQQFESDLRAKLNA